MNPTELVYSSHERCERIHRDWIVQRALESWHNKTIFYLPMSSGSRGDQEFSWGTFSWYFDRFRQYGLEPRTFFWEEDIAHEDAQRFFDWLAYSEVVILGGGATETGTYRYREMGARHFGNPNAFLETLHSRHERGLLTVGFSAGAAQLSEYDCGDGAPAFGLIAKVVTTLHYEEPSRGHLQYLASSHPESLVFGLPNDSGIAVKSGRTWRDNYWQLIHVIVDTSWDKPEDAWHIKTRQGVKVMHLYADGREWRFNDGDAILRVFYKDGGWQAFIKRGDHPVFHDYGSQHETGYRSVEDVLHDR